MKTLFIKLIKSKYAIRASKKDKPNPAKTEKKKECNC